MTAGPGRSLLIRGLVMSQFVLSIGLIICALAMARQLAYISRMDLGFNKDQVVMVEGVVLPGTIFQRLKTELSGYSAVQRITTANIMLNKPSQPFFLTTRADERVPAYINSVGDEFLETMQIELTQGESFEGKPNEDGQPVLVNETLMRALGRDHILGTELTLESAAMKVWGMRVVGVVSDFHFRSLHHAIEPLILRPTEMTPDGMVGGTILIRISPYDIPATMAFIEGVWRRLVPDKPFKFSFLDDAVNRQYQEDARWSAIVRYTSVLAILITCIGLFGLVTLATAQRTREFGIRKVLGASMVDIAFLQARGFAVFILMANIIAWPIAYTTVHKWLQNFAYRIDMGIGIFILAGVAAFVVALGAMSVQMLRASRTNPVDALRYE